VVYTRQSRRLLLDIPDAVLDGMRPSTEPYALMMARSARERFGATWALAETGATGPTGNRYGDAAGHSCIAVAGPSEAAMTLETGKSDRLDNMHTFTAAALQFLLQTVARGGA
jgi:nicotinamide mononucleotide (NMN) deamidase PncC